MKKVSTLKIYKEMQSQAQKASRGLNLNSNGKKYFVFPILKQNGFNSWESICEEFELIAKKQSKQNRVVRSAITDLVLAVNERVKIVSELNKKENVKQ